MRIVRSAEPGSAAETSRFAARFDSRSRAATDAAISGSAGAGREPPDRIGGDRPPRSPSTSATRAADARRSISGRTGFEYAALDHQRTVGGIGKASSLSSSSAIRSRDSAIRSLARAAQASSAAGRLAAPEAGVEAEEAQDPQMILGDPGQRIADEADPARLEIGEPPK
jgi:hypothetical protein